MSSPANKVVGIVAAVAIVLALSVALITCNHVTKDDRAATNYATLSTTEKNTEFSNNLTNEYSTIAPSQLQSFIDSLQTTAPTVYQKYYMVSTVNTSQLKITTALINKTIYGGKNGEVDSIISAMQSYFDKMSSTIEAIRVFNQDKTNGTATNQTLQNECELIIKRVNAQNASLLQLNKYLLDFAISNNYASSQMAYGDLKIALLNGLYRQSVVLHNALDKFINDNTTQNPNANAFDNTKIALNAFICAQNRKFVYNNINSSSGTQTEDFLALCQNTKNVNDMLSSDNPTTYIEQTTNTAQKDALNSIWNYFVKLAQGGF
ncbi:MAG: hypothetical protein IJU58_01840 [Clostridia bacterium]|nr:hypothetical protein [Clostridia bacterium]